MLKPRQRVWIGLAVLSGSYQHLTFQVPRRQALAVLLGLSSNPARAEMEEFGAPGRRVLDLAGLLPSSTEKELEKAIALLEQDTPYRFRLVSPPPGYGPEDKFGWSDFAPRRDGESSLPSEAR